MINKINIANNLLTEAINSNNNNKQNPPSTLLHDGKIVTSPKIMAKIANSYFINKIKNIRSSFNIINISPMEILKKIKPRNNNTYNLPTIDIKQMHKLKTYK